MAFLAFDLFFLNNLNWLCTGVFNLLSCMYPDGEIEPPYIGAKSTSTKYTVGELPKYMSYNDVRS